MLKNFSLELSLQNLEGQRVALDEAVRVANSALDAYLAGVRPHDNIAHRMDLIGAVARLTARVEIANGRITAISAELRDIEQEAQS